MTLPLRLLSSCLPSHSLLTSHRPCQSLSRHAYCPKACYHHARHPKACYHHARRSRACYHHACRSRACYRHDACRSRACSRHAVLARACSRQSPLRCLLRHGPMLQAHLCPMLQVLFPFMGLALHPAPWTMSVPPPLHHPPGLFGFCFCFVWASGAALRGGNM